MNKQLITKIKSFYSADDPSHDWLHILRVSSTCKKLAGLLNANWRLLEPAAFLHDVINVPKDSKDRSKASLLAANKAKQILVPFDYTDVEIEKISTIILEHSFSANIKATSIESEILQDADKLDSMGAIGVMRWATVGTKMHSSYYHQEDPWAKDRELNDKEFSLDHFETKLLKLYDRLNTDPGKSVGKIRLDFYKSFLFQLKAEIGH
jgi:uncharacterized protein